MDEDSARLYRNPTIFVEGYVGHEDAIDEACRTIFGHALTLEELAEFSGAPSGSTLDLNVVSSVDVISLKIRYKAFEEPHEYDVYVSAATEKRIVYVDNVHYRRCPKVSGKLWWLIRGYGHPPLQLCW